MNIFVFGLCFALATFASAIKRAGEKPPENFDEFSVPFNGQKFDVFDWQLCMGAAEADPGNVLISPISVKFLLNMLYECSSGETAKELEKKLNLPEDKSVARMKTSAVLRSLQSADPNSVMEIGTKIFIDHSMSPKNWFQRILFLYYNTYVEKLNFTDYKTSVDRINYWVKSVTHGHINDLVTRGNLDEAAMVLVNAIYFKGTWKTNFPPEDTFIGNFETSKGPKKIEYMKQTSDFFYAKPPEIGAQILRLPYEGQKYAMYIILPEEKDGLQHLIKTVNPFQLRKYIWQTEETPTEVILPKFMFKYKTDLKPILRKLGITKIFDSFGEMKGLIQSKKDLVVSSVIQKAGIEVNEEGSVAAAASEMQLINKIGIQDELFNASHPFLFFIEEETTGTIVFVGKFMHPVEDVSESNPTTTTKKPLKSEEPIKKPYETSTDRRNLSKSYETNQKKAESRKPSFPITFRKKI